MKKITLLLVTLTTSMVLGSCGLSSSQKVLIQKTGQVVSTSGMPNDGAYSRYGSGDTVVVYYQAKENRYMYYSSYHRSSFPANFDGHKDAGGNCKYSALVQ